MTEPSVETIATAVTAANETTAAPEQVTQQDTPPQTTTPVEQAPAQATPPETAALLASQQAVHPQFADMLRAIDAIMDTVREMSKDAPERMAVRQRALSMLQELGAVEACANLEWDKTDTSEAMDGFIAGATLQHLANRAAAHSADRVTDLYWRVTFFPEEVKAFEACNEASYNIAEDFAILLKSYSESHDRMMKARTAYMEWVRNVAPILHEIPEERRKHYASQRIALKKTMDDTGAAYRLAAVAIDEAMVANGYTPSDLEELIREADATP